MDTLGEFLKSFRPSQSGFFFMWILASLAFFALIATIERWISINRRTGVDAPLFTARLLRLLGDGKLEEAFNLCVSGGHRALPRILGAGIRRAQTVPELIRSSMEEESLHMIPRLEKRLNLIVTLGNLATLLGLMGTIYGLILAFAAVAQPHVSPVEKSSLLAVGISAAMNTTLLGLIIAVPCVLAYSIFRAKIDDTISEIDRYAVSVLKVLTPADIIQKSYRVSAQRVTEEVDTEPNMVPFMNLMVVLIPLLLSQSEFVKIGMVELKLPESSQGGGGGEGDEVKEVKLDLGIVITGKGFNLFHYFKSDTAANSPDKPVEIPKIDGKYNFEELNRTLAKVKQKALVEILRTVNPGISADMPIRALYGDYLTKDFSMTNVLKDHEAVKIVAEDKINYQTVISVMDAARGVSTSEGSVTMFPNVSIAGGIIQ